MKEFLKATSFIQKGYFCSNRSKKKMSAYNLPKTEEGDFYWNKEGYRVFTEQYHLKRGYCCRSGCKHCPYHYDKKTDSFLKKE
jgi:hypothetical protein